MNLKIIGVKSLAGFLAVLMCLGPRMVSRALADKDSDNAPDSQVKIIQQLARQGYLAEKKDFYLSAKTLTDDDINAALSAINDSTAQVDLKSLKPGDYRVEDLKSLLALVGDQSDELRDQKISVWKFENRLKKMIKALSPQEDSGQAGGLMTATATVIPTPKPTLTPTPVPGPNRAEWDEMKGTLDDLVKKAGDLQDNYDKKIDALQKNGDDLKAADAEIRAAGVNNDQQLQLVKRLLELVRDDLKKTQDHLDLVEQKATEKSISDTELQQELTIMHKDLRDNSQDVSVLKQEVAKLDKTDSEAGRNPLDDILSSKWLAGGALAVGLAALIVSLTKK